jgi:hypothetical protein
MQFKGNPFTQTNSRQMSRGYWTSFKNNSFKMERTGNHKSMIAKFHQRNLPLPNLLKCQSRTSILSHLLTTMIKISPNNKVVQQKIS